MKVNAVRWALTQRIVAVLGPETGGLAAAMTTGHEAYIPREEVDNLRAAGLAHIISISGLHMAIVGGFAFAAARLLIAAWPWLALRIHGKKAAAVVGLGAVAGYLVLSGAPPPAERAAITASVAFLAILADRQAISLHSLALAAMAVLLLQPEAVTEPGFQMSFAATAALVALAEIWPRPVREGREAVLLRPDVKLFGAELWARRRGLSPVEEEPARDARFDCDRWSCAPRPDGPVQVGAAWNLRRPLAPGRLEALCDSAEVVILRNDFRPETCAAPVVLTGRDFAAKGSVELFRTAQGWRAAWAQAERGRRPWSWGFDPR
jgi:ComEC/Rec2-related protein